MTTTDTQGIIRYQETDTFTQFSTLLNLLAVSVSAKFAANAAAGTDDTGWVDLGITSGSAFTASPTTPPKYRRVGKTVYLTGTLFRSAAPTAINALLIPAGFRPANLVMGAPRHDASLAYTIRVRSTGVVEITGAAGLSTGEGYNLGGISWVL